MATTFQMLQSEAGKLLRFSPTEAQVLQYDFLCRSIGFSANELQKWDMAIVAPALALDIELPDYAVGEEGEQ